MYVCVCVCTYAQTHRETFCDARSAQMQREHLQNYLCPASTPKQVTDRWITALGGPERTQVAM